MTDVAIIENTPYNTYGDRVSVAMEDYTTATTAYYKAVKDNLSVAKAQLAKAKTFAEKKYWNEKMEYYTSELRKHRMETAATVIAVLLGGGVLVCLCK